VQDGSKWIGTLVLFVVALIAGWPVIERMHDEVAVYNISCTKERIAGVCNGEDQTAVPMSFKVFPDQQAVIS
jgi:hypothetical protein